MGRGAAGSLIAVAIRRGQHHGALHMHLDREFQIIALRLLRHLLRSSGDMGPILSTFTAKHCPEYTEAKEQMLFHIVYELASIRTEAISDFVQNGDDLEDVEAYLA